LKNYGTTNKNWLILCFACVALATDPNYPWFRKAFSYRKNGMGSQAITIQNQTNLFLLGILKAIWNYFITPFGTIRN
jgi:hypothetical protein